MATTPVIIGSGRGDPGDSPSSDFSQAQMLMWAGQRLDPDLPVYNMIETYRIAGSIDPEIFGQAWASLVTDSDALRTTVLEVDGRPVRGDTGPLAPSIVTVDLRGETDPEGAAAAWVDERITRVHDLSSRLWDTALILVDDELTIWYLNVHHLISDGQTFLSIFRGGWRAATSWPSRVAWPRPSLRPRTGTTSSTNRPPRHRPGGPRPQLTWNGSSPNRSTSWRSTGDRSPPPRPGPSGGSSSWTTAPGANGATGPSQVSTRVGAAPAGTASTVRLTGPSPSTMT